MRLAILIVIIVAFLALGAVDIAAGSWSTGVASALLGVVNFLLLVQAA